MKTLIKKALDNKVILLSILILVVNSFLSIQTIGIDNVKLSKIILKFGPYDVFLVVLVSLFASTIKVFILHFVAKTLDVTNRTLEKAFTVIAIGVFARTIINIVTLLFLEESLISKPQALLFSILRLSILTLIFVYSFVKIYNISFKKSLTAWVYFGIAQALFSLLLVFVLKFISSFIYVNSSEYLNKLKILEAGQSEIKRNQDKKYEEYLNKQKIEEEKKKINQEAEIKNVLSYLPSDFPLPEDFSKSNLNVEFRKDAGKTGIGDFVRPLATIEFTVNPDRLQIDKALDFSKSEDDYLQDWKETYKNYFENKNVLIEYVGEIFVIRSFPGGLENDTSIQFYTNNEKEQIVQIRIDLFDHKFIPN